MPPARHLARTKPAAQLLQGGAQGRQVGMALFRKEQLRTALPLCSRRRMGAQEGEAGRAAWSTRSLAARCVLCQCGAAIPAGTVLTVCRMRGRSPQYPTLVVTGNPPLVVTGEPALLGAAAAHLLDGVDQLLLRQLVARANRGHRHQGLQQRHCVAALRQCCTVGGT